MRPVTTGPGGNCDAVLEHGGRLSRVYFDHLRVDASNVLVAEPRIYEYVAGYLDLPHKQTTDAHACLYSVYHKTVALHWHLLTWVKYALHPRVSRMRKQARAM